VSEDEKQAAIDAMIEHWKTDHRKTQYVCGVCRDWLERIVRAGMFALETPAATTTSEVKEVQPCDAG